MKKKLKVGIIFGGKSAEHEVSLQSAKNVIAAIDKEKYEPILIGVNKAGQWLLLEDCQEFLASSNDLRLAKLNESNNHISLPPQSNGQLAAVSAKHLEQPVDVFFPVLHGPFGEDGTVQGLLKLANAPFVGAGVLGSAVGMDKDVMKRLLREANLPVGKFLVYGKHESINYAEVVKELELPLFVKPANLGSSVGISKVNNEAEFSSAVADAFQYDRKIIFEQTIIGREIECSVLGNEANPIASLPGEIVPTDGFYSYEAKYIDAEGAKLIVPADLPATVIKQVQDLAIKTFKVLCCEGMARVDFFLTEDNKLFVNEINTIPGFTQISMYPKLWQETGISYTDLIDKLIQLALERYDEESKLKNAYSF